jgi:hypothetical protein
MPLLPRESAKEIFTLVTDRVLNDMRCFRGELTLGVHKIPFLEFSPEMAEQLVGAVDQVDLHRSERYHFAALVFSAEQPRANAVSWHPTIISICNAMPHVFKRIRERSLPRRLSFSRHIRRPFFDS